VLSNLSYGGGHFNFNLYEFFIDLYRIRAEREANRVPKVLPDIKLQLFLLDGLINANMQTQLDDNPFKMFNVSRRVTTANKP
jgi:hypothetical protein